MSATDPVIVLENVRKVFRSDDLETHALENVSLRIEKGEYLAIDGPSGSGKSTLLSILGLLEAPTAGRYLLNGQDVSMPTASARAAVRSRDIGFVFQNFNLLGHLTVAQNVELPLIYRRMAPRQRKDAVRTALDLVGLTPQATQRPGTLSGGQQQRVAVARAVAGRPAIVLADEPTGNLDSASGDDVMALLATLHRNGATVCLVTHDERYARQADRAVHLFDGRVVEAKRPGHRLASPIALAPA